MIRNMGQYLRPLLFDGMQFGKLTPMDGDAILDIKGKATMFFEVKSHNGQMPLGQRLTYQHIVDNMREDRMAVIVLCDSKPFKGNEPMYLSECRVRQVYYGRQWHTPEEPVTAKEFTEQYIRAVSERYGLNL